MDGIRYESQGIFDYWKAAKEIHHIANKKLFVIYRNDFNFSFPNIHGEKEDDKLLIYLDALDEVKFVRRFVTENNTIHSDPIDVCDFQKVKNFLNTIEGFITDITCKVSTRTDFLKNIDTGHQTIVWEVY